MVELKKKAVKKPAAAKAHAAKPRVKKEPTEEKQVILEAAVEVKTQEEPTVSDKKMQYYGALGRRKQATAMVRLYKNGTGKVTVNGKSLKDFFKWDVWEDNVLAPLKTVGQADKLDVTVTVRGGGLSGQSDAVRHGISRALLLFNPVFRRGLKKVGFLKRDPRVKERKHYGLKRPEGVRSGQSARLCL